MPRKKKKLAKSPPAMRWEFDPDVPTNDFLGEGSLEDTWNLQEAVENFVYWLEKDRFLTWEAVVCEEQGLALTAKQKEALGGLLSFNEEADDQILYINEIPRPRQVRKSLLTVSLDHGGLGLEVDAMTKLKLTHRQRVWLQRQLKDTPDPRVFRRSLAILECSQGRPIARIADMLAVTRQSVYNWIEAYAQAHDPGALSDADRCGRPSLWTEDLRVLLQTLVHQSPDERGYFAVNWTVPLVQEEIEHCTGQRLSDDTLRRELDQLGYVWKRGRYVLDPDPERAKKTTDSSAGPQNSAVVAAQRIPC